MVLSHLRFAAGVCVLAAGLLMGTGGTVAAADPDSSGSTTASSHANSPKKEPGGTKKQPSTSATSPKKDPGGTASKDGSLGSSGQPGQQPSSSGAKKPKVEPVGTDTKDGTKDDSDLGAAVADPVAGVPNEVAPVSEVAVAPVSDPVAAVPNEVAPVPDVVAPVFDVVGPVSDVSVLVQDMLTSVAEAAVLLAQLPSDLSSFLLGVAGVPPVVGEVAGIHGPGRSAAAGASVASRWPLGLPPAGISGPPLAGASRLPVTGEATGVAPLDVIALGRASALSGMAPQAPNGAFPVGAESFFPHVVFEELLLIASRGALATVTLPGIGGLVILTVVGVRIQYGRITPDSRREHRAVRDSPVPRAVKRWMSAR